MKEYKVSITPFAEAQLKEIVRYIAFNLANPTAANAFLNRTKERILRLRLFPEGYPLVERSPWNEKGLRSMFVKTFLVYFVVDSDKAEVSVLAIIYGRRDQFK